MIVVRSMNLMDKVRVLIWILLSNRKLLRSLLIIVLTVGILTASSSTTAYGDDGRDPDPEPGGI
ncbi:MAG: hypothetical protein DRJ49_05490 [Thermoprotei archaeon]|nr:MAG: hypothetical protein DRJ49_05490 [Thermoprotei archaeon]